MNDGLLPVDFVKKYRKMGTSENFVRNTDIVSNRSVYSKKRSVSDNANLGIPDIFKYATGIKINQKNKIDGLSLVETIKDESITASFFDPQYRGIMDKMNYGNEGSRQKVRAVLTQMNFETITSFIKEIDRVLIKSGHLFLWIDKFHLCEGVTDWFKDTNLNIVDLITWNKCKMAMGYRTRRQCEYLLVLQKKPLRAKGVWSIHNIRDVWKEKVSTTNHPHTKPVGLQTELIKSISNEHDFIMDLCAGSFSVLDACSRANRNFIGGDIEIMSLIKNSSKVEAMAKQ